MGRWLPLLRVGLLSPELLVRHLGAYADLLAEESEIAILRIRKKFIWQMIALVATTLAISFLGTGAMLWATAPEGSLRYPWVLLLVPLVPLVAAAWAHGRCAGLERFNHFDQLRRQIATDLDLLTTLHKRPAKP